MDPNATLAEERREVLDCVLACLRTQESGADRIAACSFLLAHLAKTNRRAIMDPERKLLWRLQQPGLLDFRQ